MSIINEMKPRAQYVPVWTASDRFKKAREDFGMSMREFARFTDLSMRQVQMAEDPHLSVKDTVYIVYAFKTGVNYHWLVTGEDPTISPDGPGGGNLLLGLDSNQEPIGSLFAYKIRKEDKEAHRDFIERAA